MNQLLPGLLNRPFKRKITAQLTTLLAVTTALTTVSAQQAKPVVVNQQTGAQVELTRAYWNANVDIADRPIKCEVFRFNAESSVYEYYLAREYMHAPLLSTTRGSYVTNDVSVPGFAVWTVQDGVYSGVADFDSHEYLELVSYKPSLGFTNQGSGNDAIRVWHSPSVYSVCFDQGGTSFVPTGSADIGNTNLVVLDELEDFSFQFPPSLNMDHEVPVVYRDGARVSFVRGEWDYNSQLANKTVSCVENLPPYNGIGSPESPISVSQNYLAYFGGDAVYLHETYSDFDDIDRYTYSRSTDNIDLGGLGFPNKYMELTENGFNLYASPSRSFSCTAPLPKRVVALMPEGCDYSSADQFGGWGWNTATSQSCAPLENIVDTQLTAQCIDTDGDGYGWDGAATCLVDSGNSVDTMVTAGNCDYSNANLYGGWGWNAATSESCAPLENVSETQPSAQCIDTDGDGYGWDGARTCLVDSDSHVGIITVSHGACDYSNADLHGGWGWNATTSQSCPPLENVPSARCIDIDGDGYGWDGNASCIP